MSRRGLGPRRAAGLPRRRGTRLASMGERVDEAATSVNNKASGVLGTWEGESATSYDAHRRTLVTSIDEATNSAARVSTALQRAAGSVRKAQADLRRLLVERRPTSPPPGVVAR